MKCSCCGEEVGEVKICPVCGGSVTPRAASVGAAPKHSADEGVRIFEDNKNGVMEIYTDSGSGSGYLVTKDGFGITNSHVLVHDGVAAVSFRVKISGQQVTARTVAVLTKNESDMTSNKDLAVIKLDRVPAEAKPVKFGDSEKVRTGEKIYIIGNSLGRGTLITSGIISDNNRNGQFMYDSATNGGNSGGPVFNAEGLVVATHVYGSRGNDGSKVQGMNGGIPCRYAKELLLANGVRIK